MTRVHDIDWQSLGDTWDRWWAHDLERPLVLAQSVDPFERPAWWGRQFGGIPAEISAEDIAEVALRQLEATEFLGDEVPKCWMNFGPGSLAACLGGELQASDSTTWFTPGIHAGRSIAELRLGAAGGRWQQRIDAVAAACAERFGRQAVVGFSDLGGNLDILASLRDSNQLLLDLMDDPEEVDRLCREITAQWWQAYEAECSLREPLGLGTAPWAAIWSRQRCYMLQSDFSYMISPKQFARWVVPDLTAICTRIPHGFYHLDGKGELPHLDHLLAVPGLQGVQWIPGDGNPVSADPQWWEVLQRIRAAGKLVQLYSPGSAVLELVRHHPCDGFVLATWSDQPGLSNADLVSAIRHEAEATRLRRRPLVAVGAGT